MALTAAFCRLGHPVATERTPEALTSLLSDSLHGPVETFGWEGSRGRATDLLDGRPLLFLGRESDEQPRDVYRAFVRVSPDGAPLSVTRIRNLTRTELADERGLVVRDPFAAFATVAFDEVQSVTVLDTRGSRYEASGWAPRLAHALRSMQTTGTIDGLGRTDVGLAEPTDTLDLELTSKSLLLSTAAGEARLRLSPAGIDVESPASLELEVDERHYRDRPLPHVLADVARGYVGTGAVAWLEGRLFELVDGVHRVGYVISSGTEEAAPVTPEPRPLSLGAAPDAGKWPPPNLVSRWKKPRPDEGVWKPVDHAFLRRLPHSEGEAPYFFTTFVRPDPERPYAEVTLVAMDTRRLELDVEGGYEDPHPTAGPPGSGHVPKDPAAYRRIVATFNGAFKTDHGEYGMMVDGRLLVPPLPGAATVRIDEDGRTGLGTWPPPEGNGEAPKVLPIPAEMRSFRQNLDPLIEGDTVNPTGREVWGDQLYGQGVATERSALCVTGGGHLVYAWSPDASGATLAEALRMAGCQYGVHLDMNPGHCAFVFTNIKDYARVEADTAVLDERMRINPKRYIRWSPKDFFYVKLRNVAPETQKDFGWKPDGGAQPKPRFLPAILSGGYGAGALTVELTRFAAGRFHWLVRAGLAEPSDGPAPERELPPEVAAHVLAAIGIGHTTEASRFGLAFGTTTIMPLDRELATLRLAAGGPPRLIPPGEPIRLQTGSDLVQLPVLARGGKLLERAHDLGALRERGALCIDEENNVLLAKIHHDSVGPAAQALVELGCDLVVETDRGSHHPPFVERAGSESPPRAGHEATVLYAAAAPMESRAYWWRPEKEDSGAVD